jgi:hypothetical protein
MTGRTRIALVISLVVALTACGWTQYGGNAGHTGQAPFEHALTTTNAAAAKVLWTTSLDTYEAVIADGMVYATTGGAITAYPVTPGAQCSGTPRVCNGSWAVSVRSPSGLSDPVVVDGMLYVGAVVTGRWTVRAYDLAGPCPTATLPGCAPTWIGDAGPAPEFAPTATLIASDGRIFLVGDGIPITAFDGHGHTNCSGTPVTCRPLFTALGAPRTSRLPAIDGDRLLVPVPDGIEAFDAAGKAGCVASQCSPRFRLAVANPGDVSAAGGTAYTETGRKLFAFDDTGATGCSGAPVVCQPTWRATLAGLTQGEAPIIAGTRVFANSIGMDGFNEVGSVEAFDRTASNCSGSPLTCTSEFRTTRGSTYPRARASASATLLVVASSSGPSSVEPSSFRLSFYDLAGVSGCNAQRRCDPIATLDLGVGTQTLGQVGHPAIANGVVVVPRWFDAPMVVGLP